MPFGNLHLEHVYVESDNESNDLDHDEISELSSSELKMPTFTDESSIISDDDEDKNDTGYFDNTSLSTTISPFACDPYESYDWEC